MVYSREARIETFERDQFHVMQEEEIDTTGGWTRTADQAEQEDTQKYLEIRSFALLLQDRVLGDVLTSWL